MIQPIVDSAYAFLRGHTTADLRFDENMREIKYVIGHDGKLVIPVMVAMLRSVDTVLFVPDYSEGAMELQVTLLEFDERGEGGAAADRWRIYHGEPPDVRWAFASIDMARSEEIVIDGDALMRSNPLAGQESQLCKHLNGADQVENLRRLSAHYGTMVVDAPIVVGVDSLGIDVRAMYDVVRIPTPREMDSADDVKRVLKEMIANVPSDSPKSP